MHILVTAGNTLVPIDRVRAITNIFTGRTGAAIAIEASRRGHAVTLLTSHPDTVAGHSADSWRCQAYRWFYDLAGLLEYNITSETPDALVHSAAVSDYYPVGIYAPAPGTQLQGDGTWQGAPPAFVDRVAAKVKSDEPELWVRLARTPKLIDRVRRDLHFRGILVKFKLEVTASEAELLTIAEHSRRQSDADWMVANAFDEANEWAYLGAAHGYERIQRPALAARLIDVIEKQHAERSHG